MEALWTALTGRPTEDLCQAPAHTRSYYCDEEPMCSRWNELQQEAREAEMGLWAEDEPIEPWEWRRK